MAYSTAKKKKRQKNAQDAANTSTSTAVSANAADDSNSEVIEVTPAQKNTISQNYVLRELREYPAWTTWVFNKTGVVGGFILWAVLMVLIWPVVLSVGSAALSIMAIRIVGGYPQVAMGEMGITGPIFAPVLFLTIFTAIFFAWFSIKILGWLGRFSSWLAKALFWDRDRTKRKQRSKEKAEERKRVREENKKKREKDKAAKIKARADVEQARDEFPEL